MQQNTPTRILRMKEVSSRVNLCKAMIYRFQAQGDFPKSIKLSQSATGWYEHEVEAWLAARISTNASAR